MAPPSAMKILCWNCQGLGNTLTVHHYTGISKSHSPDLVFQSEAKNKEVTKFLAKGGIINNFIVDPLGTACGLVLGWKAV